MAEPIQIGDFLFYEIDFGLLAACEDGHRAEVWTKPDYDFVNIYLDGFPMGAGKVAALRKSDNPKLVRMLDSNSILYAVIQKNSDTQYKLLFKERTEEDLLRVVAEARAFADSPGFQIASAERELKTLAAQKLIAKYRPTILSTPCALRTPAPLTIPISTPLKLMERSPEWYVATKIDHVTFCDNISGAVGYIKASLDVKTRIIKAHFNGYQVTAIVTGVVAGVQRHGLASFWDEIEHQVEVNFLM